MRLCKSFGPASDLVSSALSICSFWNFGFGLLPLLQISLVNYHTSRMSHCIDREHDTQSSKDITEKEDQSFVSENFCSRLIYFCNSRSLKEGISVHGAVIKLGFKENLFLNNNLLSLYLKCSQINQAQKLFEEMSLRDMISWTGLISGYVKQAKFEDALELFDHMVISGFIPNEFTYSSVLRSCSSLADFERGTCIHTQIIKRGFDSNLILSSALIDLYSKCKKFEEALKVFQTMIFQDIISWTAIISAATDVNNYTLALKFYSFMIEEGITPNEYTFVNLLTACDALGFEFGQSIHAHVILWGAKMNLILKTSLVDMYCKFSDMEDAFKMMNQTPESDVFLWTTIVSGYNQLCMFREAIASFQKMEEVSIKPNDYAYAGVLNACSSLSLFDLGKQIHSQVFKVGLEDEISVGNALVDLYMKCSDTTNDALCIFKCIVSPNVVSWTSLISGFSEHGVVQEALSAFSEMKTNGIQPNSFTVSSVLKGCVNSEDIYQVQKLHAYTYKTHLIDDIIVGNALIDTYSRMKRPNRAWNTFTSMKKKDAITYTTLAGSTNQVGDYEKTLVIFSYMLRDDIKMDAFVLSSFLTALANLSAMEPGRQLHSYSIKSGLDRNTSVSNGLIDMYGKCGSVRDAHKTFTAICKPNVVSWNGLISALASNSDFTASLSAFEDMRMTDIQPDQVTMLLVLYACSHGGLVDLGSEYFNSMVELYGILPQLDHYVCLVDLLGRAGRLEEALNLIETMPFIPDALIYKTLLGSCRVHPNVALAEHVFRKALELDPLDPAIYVLLANIYDDFGKIESSKQIRGMMRERKLKKNPGQSWVEIRNEVYHFMSGDTSNPQIEEIHEKLKLLRSGIKRIGCDYLEDRNSYYHSEKLAISFALINTPCTAPVRIIKNLRICADCHTFAKLVTKVINREIIIRDGKRFHYFDMGGCSCKDYW